MRPRSPLNFLRRVAAVLALLLVSAGLASAAGVRIAAPATGGTVSPQPASAATPVTPSVGGTPSPGPVILPIIRRRRPISASPAVRTIRPGARTTFVIRLQPSRTVRSYRLRLWRAPKGVTLHLNHTRARTRATLTVRTTATIRTGRYTLRISAWPRRRPGARRAPKVLRTAMALVVSVPKPVRSDSTPVPAGKLYAAGDVTDPLVPGVARPIHVVVTNAFAGPVDVTAITATVTAVAPVDGGACSTADFTTMPATLSTPLRIPADTSATLLALGLPRGSWPAAMLVDRAVNQDGCKGALVALRFDVQGRDTG